MALPICLLDIPCFCILDYYKQLAPLNVPNFTVTGHFIF